MPTRPPARGASVTTASVSGGFDEVVGSVDELDAVPGIGPGRLEQSSRSFDL
jgi:hypothetical protein